MLELFTIAVAAIVLLAAAVVLYASRKPDTFETTRSVLIDATPERIFPLIAHPKAFNSWNPFLEDPGVKGRYSGPETGPGARYTFESRRSGSGYSEIAAEEPPRHLHVRLVMTRPMACDNRVEFRLVPEAGKTRITWAMSGRSPLAAKVMGLFVDCDKMCGDQFTRGLEKLKSLAEGQTAEPAKAS